MTRVVMRAESIDDILLQSLCPQLVIRPTMTQKVLGTELVVTLSRTPFQTRLELTRQIKDVAAMFVEWFQDNVGPEGIDWGLHHIDHRVIFHVRNQRIAMMFKLRFV